MVGHEGPVSSLFFSPIKATLVSGSWDRTVRVWDVYDSTAPKESLEIGSDGMYAVYSRQVIKYSEETEKIAKKPKILVSS